MSRTREVVRRYRDLMTGAPDVLQTAGGIMSSEHEPRLSIAVCHCGDAAAGDRLIAHWRACLRPESDDIERGPYSADATMPPMASGGRGFFLPDLNDDVIDVLAESFSVARCRAPRPDRLSRCRHAVPVDVMASLRHAGYDVRPGELTAVARRQAAPSGCGVHDAHARGRGVRQQHRHDAAARTVEAYGANYERLTTIKATYDPDNFFHLNHNIGRVGEREPEPQRSKG